MENTELIQIPIIATTTQEKLEILATRKGRQNKIQKPTEPIFDEKGVEVEQEYIEIDNPDTADLFIKRVYENMIIDDISKIFTDIALQEINAQKTMIEQKVKDDVKASIS